MSTRLFRDKDFITPIPLHAPSMASSLSIRRLSVKPFEMRTLESRLDAWASGDIRTCVLESPKDAKADLAYAESITTYRFVPPCGLRLRD